MTLVDEFKTVVTFFSSAPIDEIVVACLLLFVGFFALLFEALWLRERRHNRNYHHSENNENTLIAEPTARIPFIANIRKVRNGSLGKLAEKASSIAFWIMPSIHKTKRPVPMETTQAIKSLTPPESSTEHEASQSQKTRE